MTFTFFRKKENILGFILFLIAIYIAYKFFSSDSGGSNQVNHNNSSGSWYHPDGEFIEGFYIEDRDVYAKGPVYTFNFGEHGILYGYEEGILQLRNSTGNIEIQLKQVNDRRIVPIFFHINGKSFSVVDRNGHFLDHTNSNFNIISVVHTFSHMYTEISDANFNEQLKTDVYIFMRDLLIFNMLIKRGIISKFENQNIFVSNKYDGPIFVDKFKEIFAIAEETIDTHMGWIASGNNDSRISTLLEILELPIDTRDMNVIKKKYRSLAKKYHPDTGNGSEEKMKKINVAYEELCQHLAAS